MLKLAGSKKFTYITSSFLSISFYLKFIHGWHIELFKLRSLGTGRHSSYYLQPYVNPTVSDENRAKA